MLTTTRLIVPEDCEVTGGIPVGTAVPGTEVFVLNTDDQPCHPDQEGEICIAGHGLAIGYLGMPEYTAEKFPTVQIGGTPVRVYRTGDIGVFDKMGVLHFRGRNDRQVKISGHRIEIAEIEVAARALAGVRDCVALPVTAADGSVTGLALLYIPETPGSAGQHDAVGECAGDGLGTRPTALTHLMRQEKAGDPLGVRGGLSRALPSYLVPGIARAVRRFPITANGKLDTAELLRLARRPLSAEEPPAEEDSDAHTA